MRADGSLREKHQTLAPKARSGTGAWPPLLVTTAPGVLATADGGVKSIQTAKEEVKLCL